MCSCSTVLPWWQTQYVMITHVTHSDWLCWAWKLYLIIRTVVTKYSTTVSAVMLENKINTTNIISRIYTQSLQLSLSKLTRRFATENSALQFWQAATWLSSTHTFSYIRTSTWQWRQCIYLLCCLGCFQVTYLLFSTKESN